MGCSIQQTTDNGYIVAGMTWSFGNGIYLIKTDINGNQQWQKIFGHGAGDQGFSVKQAIDGGYIVTGRMESSGAGKSDVFLIKTDSQGNLLWQKTFGGTDYDQGNSVQQTSDGGYIVAGGTSSFGAGAGDVYLIKTDSNGDLMWEKTFGGMDYDVGLCVDQTSDGGYIVAGVTYSFGTSNDIYLVKLASERTAVTAVSPSLWILY